MRGGVEAGLRLGVGKAEQESFYTAADNVVRKKLEVELQADENQERRDKREVQPPLLRTQIEPTPTRPVVAPFAFQEIHVCLLCVRSGMQILSYLCTWAAYVALQAVDQSLIVSQSLQSC